MADEAQDLRVTFVASEARVVITIAGELDIAVCDRLRAHLSQLLDGPARSRAPRVILDVAAVDFVDATGLRPILEARTRLAEDGRTLRLRRAQPRVRRILELLQLGDLLDS